LFFFFTKWVSEEKRREEKRREEREVFMDIFLNNLAVKSF